MALASHSLYDLLDFTTVEQAEGFDLKELDSYLREASNDFTKNKTYTDKVIIPPTLETGFVNCIFGRSS